MAFLAQSVRCVVGVSEIQGRTLGPRRWGPASNEVVQLIDSCRSPWDGFVYLILAIQQALPAYYFLTAFAPSQSLVGRGLDKKCCLLALLRIELRSGPTILRSDNGKLASIGILTLCPGLLSGWPAGHRLERASRGR